VVCAPEPLPQSPAQFAHDSPPSHVRLPQTGPPPLLLELLLELLLALLLELLLELLLALLLADDAALLLDEALELLDISPLLLAMFPLVLDEVTPFPPLPFPPLPVDVWPLLFVPVEFVGAPPAPPTSCSSGPPGASLMTPVHAPRARASAESAKRVRCCMILRLYGK